MIFVVFGLCQFQWVHGPHRAALSAALQSHPSVRPLCVEGDRVHMHGVLLLRRLLGGVLLAQIEPQQPQPQPVVVPPFALALAAAVGPIEFLTTSLPELLELLRTLVRTPCRGHRRAGARARCSAAPQVFFCLYFNTIIYLISRID